MCFAMHPQRHESCANKSPFALHQQGWEWGLSSWPQFPVWKTASVKVDLPGCLYSAFLIYPYTPRWCLRVVEQRLWETFPMAGYLLHLLSGVKIWNKVMPWSGFGEKLHSAGKACWKVTLTQLNRFSFTFFFTNCLWLFFSLLSPVNA